MNDLQKLIKLRGLTALKIAENTGCGYHMVQKVVKGTRYKRKDGSLGTYSNQEVQQAVALTLGLSRMQAFGPTRSTTLKRLIRAEIAKRRLVFEHTLTSKYLPDNGTIAEQRLAGNG